MPITLTRRVTLLTAVRNEAGIIGRFLDEVHCVFQAVGWLGDLTVVLVDDASTDHTIAAIHALTPPGLRVTCISVPSNRGNQSAMAYGLRQLAGSALSGQWLLTCDADGEDDIAQFPALIAMLERDPSKIVFVRRSSRISNRFLYWVYCRIYRYFTGQRVLPCNMMAIPGSLTSAIAKSPLLPLHFSAAILRLGFKHQVVPIPRRQRYGGDSSQNIPLLIHHALLSLGVFYEQVAARFLVFSVLVAAIAGSLFGTAAFFGFGFAAIALFVLVCLLCSIFRLLIEVNWR